MAYYQTRVTPYWSRMVSAAHQWNGLDARLRDEQAVERVSVMERESCLDVG